MHVHGVAACRQGQDLDVSALHKRVPLVGIDRWLAFFEAFFVIWPGRVRIIDVVTSAGLANLQELG